MITWKSSDLHAAERQVFFEIHGRQPVDGEEDSPKFVNANIDRIKQVALERSGQMKEAREAFLAETEYYQDK